MKPHSRFSPGWIALAVMLLALPVGSQVLNSGLDALSCGIKDVTTIQDGRGSSRILFNLDGAVLPENISIARATLTFDLSGAASAEALRFWIHPVTAPWSAGSVSWTSGWSRGGGDFEETVFARAEVDLSQKGALSIDVTPIL